MMRSLPGPMLRSDGWLWLAVALLLPLGLLMVSSASAVGAVERLTPEARRQAVYAGMGAAAMLLAARIDYRSLRPLARPAFLVSLSLLGAVIVAGVSNHGAQRWLGIGQVTFQPSEFAKLALCLALAAYAAERRPSVPALATSAGILGVTAGLVLAQPDLGTVVVLSGAWVLFLVGWGVGWRVLGGLAATGVAVGPLAFALAVPAYQRERIAVFLDPGRDPLGSGFNLRQVELALGSAGVTGHGLYSGAESHLDAVAARSSDFMFGFLGAELGLAGGLLLLGLLALVVLRGYSAAASAPDTFGRLLATALTSVILVQGAVNVAVNLRLFPATGIPLPFVAQGGSALIVMLTAVGILQSIASRSDARRRPR